MAETLLRAEFEAASARVFDDPRLDAWVGLNLELWLFEDREARDALAARLARKGITARVRSAYKPLLHFFIEDVAGPGVAGAQISYPRHPQAEDVRFLSEAYPLADLIAGPGALGFAAQAATPGLPCYEVQWVDRAGAVHREKVVAPNRVRSDPLNRLCLAPCGWIRVSDPATGAVLVDEPIETEFERVYDAAMSVIATDRWGRAEPYFARLEVQIELPGAEVCAPDGTLLFSTFEALHEDLYFSALEYFQHHSGRPPGDRGLQPGQIVPDIRRAAFGSLASVHVLVHRVGESVPPLPDAAEAPESGAGLDDLRAPASASRVARELRAIGALAARQSVPSHDALPFAFYSCQGRAVQGVLRAGLLAPVVVTGGQHANEASGVVGALRGARWLAVNPQAHFACVPLENPDGYDLFGQYCAIHPAHMHHAARYTALGDDLEYRERDPWFEKGARMHALAATGAQLHLSLHGYPAHEWTRPMTGYLPRGFELWSLPKGFFLILRYKAGWREIAESFLDALTGSLSEVPGLAEFNARQLATYAAHAGGVPFEVRRGFACMVSQNDRQTPGVVLVTEFPDETIRGDAFLFAHEVQMQTVRRACEIWWTLMPGKDQDAAPSTRSAAS